MASVSIGDRLVSALSYCTWGIFSLIWLIFANITKKHITPFLNFNIYQSIVLSIALAVISLIYSIAINILAAIPFLGKLAVWFDLFFNHNPVFHSFTVSGLLVTILLIYLVLLVLSGRRPHLPLISDMINGNFGG